MLSNPSKNFASVTIVARDRQRSMMKNAFRFVTAALAVSCVSAHYIFEQLSIGSTKYAVYQYSMFLEIWLSLFK